MVQRREIELLFPGRHTFNYRVLQEPGAIHLDRLRALNPSERIGFFLSLALSVAPLIFYLVALAVMPLAGATMGVAGHVLALGFSLTFLAIVGYMTVEFERYEGSTLARDGNGALRLQFRWRGGRERTYPIEEPATLVILLTPGTGHAKAAGTASGPSGEPQQEHFQETLEVELELHAAAIPRRSPFQSRHWIKWMPRYMECYHHERGAEANIEATVDALRPLASAVRDTLHVSVEFRLIGGTPIERMEVVAG